MYYNFIEVQNVQNNITKSLRVCLTMHNITLDNAIYPINNVLNIAYTVLSREK